MVGIRDTGPLSLVWVTCLDQTVPQAMARGALLAETPSVVRPLSGPIPVHAVLTGWLRCPSAHSSPCEVIRMDEVPSFANGDTLVVRPLVAHSSPSRREPDG